MKKGSEAVLCEGLVENLVSVGRLCDDEHTLVFDKYGCAVFKSEISVTGNRVHAQDRDLTTGLYPIHLTTECVSKDSSTEEKANGAPVSHFLGNLLRSKIYLKNVSHLREVFAPISMWANKICTERMNETFSEEEKGLDTRETFFKGYLARFYIREGMSDMERWHNKLGHVGTKIVRTCDIPNLKIPSTPFRCESCIRGKMHSGNHSSKSTGRKTDLKPGEYIITDL